MFVSHVNKALSIPRVIVTYSTNEINGKKFDVHHKKTRNVPIRDDTIDTTMSIRKELL